MDSNKIQMNGYKFLSNKDFAEEIANNANLIIDKLHETNYKNDMDYTEQEIAEAIELRRQLNGICHFKDFRHNVENYASLELKQVDKSFIKVNDYEHVMSIDELPKSMEVIAKLKEFYTLELRKNDHEENTEVYVVTVRTETEQEHNERIEHETFITTRENKLIELAKAALNNRLIKDYFNLQDLLKL